MAIYQGQITSSLSFLCCQITVQWSYTGFRVLILFLLAPASSSTRTVSRCPPAAAIHKGDIQSSFALSFAAPHASSQRTISNWPLSAAANSGVIPVLLVWSFLAPASTRKRTTSRCPVWATTCKGVHLGSAVRWSLSNPVSVRKRTMLRMLRCLAFSLSVKGLSWPQLLERRQLRGCHARLASSHAAAWCGPQLHPEGGW